MYMDIGTKTMSSKAKVDLKAAMPLTAAWIKTQRELMGNEHVTKMIKDAMGDDAANVPGKPDCFYAIEGGHILGTPFRWNPEISREINIAALSGARFIAAIRAPDKACDLVIAPTEQMMTGHWRTHATAQQASAG
jgi:hypothetical protein